MTKENKELIMTFLMNCYDSKVFDDELSQKEISMHKKLWELEDILNETQRSIYIELEGLIAEVMIISKERYFEYGTRAQQGITGEGYLSLSTTEECA